MSVLESAIAWVSPLWAAKRAEARQYLRAINVGVNDQSARTRDSWRAGTPDQEVQQNRSSYLATARKLYATNSWAVGAVNSITGNVIGKGMRPESALMVQSGERKGQPATEQNDQVEAVFGRWASGCDLSGKRSFSSIQRFAYRERWIANDVFVRRHTVSDREIPLALEVVSGELLSDRTEGAINQGIEFNARGEPVAYHFLSDESTTETARVPAEDVIHLFRPHRPGAVRGLSPLAPVASSFEALRRYLNHELTRAAIASAFVALHKTGGRGITGLATGNAGDAKDAHGNTLLQILDGGGMLLTGGPNDSLESASPAIQSTAFDPFVRLVLRSIATGLGISYELLARDFTQTNFSSARQSNLEDRRQWEPEQEEFINDLLMRVWDWFVDAASMARVAPFSLSRREWPVTWTAQGWLWVDPQKEIAATIAAIEVGIDNPIDAARRVGRDFHENVRKKRAAEAFAEEMGTKLGGNGSATEAPDGNDEDEEEEAQDAPEAAGSEAA